MNTSFGTEYSKMGLSGIGEYKTWAVFATSTRALGEAIKSQRASKSGSDGDGSKHDCSAPERRFGQVKNVGGCTTSREEMMKRPVGADNALCRSA